MSDDAQKLARYARDGSEEAFAELVRRYLDLVYSTALRRVGGDAHLAQDVAQTVFAALARKARGLSPNIVLGGWLYRHACFVAAQTVRGETRRRAREREAATMTMTDPESEQEPDWARLAPFLDDAMAKLGERERNAIVLRFFERRDLRSVGLALGASDEAARKTVSRAVEKLRSLLVLRGVALSAGALSIILAERAVTAAPLGLAANITVASLATAGTGAVAGISILKTIAIMNIKTAAAGAIAVGLATAVVIEHQSLSKLRDENAQLREASGELTALREHVRTLESSSPGPGELKRLQAEHLELMRLRAQTPALKQNQAEIARLKAENDRLRSAPPPSTVSKQSSPSTDSDAEAQRALVMNKMNYAQSWSLAFILYAQANAGVMPQSIAQADQHFPSDRADVKSKSDPNQWEVIYHGSLNSLANPGQTIILRETVPSPAPNQQGLLRVYAFADGHSEAHMSAPDGTFDAWEQQMGMAPPGQ
jgi:RNA polymerase sigma factor (sigma-70 family)